jgi:hypothetical protein
MPSFLPATSAMLLMVLLTSTMPGSAKTKNLPARRWETGAPGCQFQSTDDGHYRWRMTSTDLDMVVVMDAQELHKTPHRLYHGLGVYLSVNYTGRGKFDFPADLRMEFVRHHNLTEGYDDPTELATTLQNSIDKQVFETERDIKKHPEKNDEETALAREYQKEVSEFIEFVSTQSLQPAILTPGNPEVHGWVFFSTKNKWIGPWKQREDFILRVWMKDRIWEFPFSMPPSDAGDIILKKRDE